MARSEFRRGLLRPVRVAELAILALGALLGYTPAYQVGSEHGSDFAIATALATVGFLPLAMFTVIAVGVPVIEDTELRVRSVLLGTSLQPREYAFGKFVGALAARAVCVALFWCGLLVAAGRAPDGALVTSFALIALPPLVLIGGLAFAVGLRTGSRVAVFGVGTVVTVTVWTLFWSWTPSWLDPSIDAVLCWLDPSGYRWIDSTYFAVARGADYYDSAAVGWSPAFVASRLLLALLGIGAVAGAVWRFREVDRPAAPILEARAELTVEVASGRMRAPGALSAIRSVAALEYRALLCSPGLAFFAVMLAVSILSTSWSAVGAFDAPLLLTSGNAVTRTQVPVAILSSLFAICCTAEALGRERACGLEEIHTTSPVRPTQRIAGKLLAVASMALTLLGFVTSLHAVATWIQGAVTFEVAPFVVGYGVGVLPAIALWVAVAFFWYAIFRSRVATLTLSTACMGLSLLVLFTSPFDSIASLLNWCGFAVGGWSDLGSMVANTAELGARAGRTLLLASPFALGAWWVGRSPDAYVKSGWRLAHALALAVPLAIAVVPIERVLGPPTVSESFSSSSDAADAAEFALSDVDVDLDIDPRTGAFRTIGTLELRRRGEGTLALWGGQGWQSVDWTLDGQPARPEVETMRGHGFGWRHGARDTRYGFPQLPPDSDRVSVGFTIAGNLSATVPWNPYLVRPAGAVLDGSDGSFLPGLRRRETWIPVDPPQKDPHGITEPLFGNRVPFTARIRVTSPADYVFNTVGQLLEDVVADGRRTRSFTTDYPVVAINVVGARYAVRRGALAEIYHHPGHGYNVDMMLQCLERGRVLFSEWFHPYPWQQLRLNEFPGHVTYAQGYATNIHFSESIGFLARPDVRVNLPFLVTAHELAHQWWGNLVVPGKGNGGNVISEGLAHFSTILLTEACRSSRERIELCKRFEQGYLAHREPKDEHPLAEARPWDNVLVYEKGGWVFWMLLHAMGRERMLAGLRQFIAEYHGNEDHPLPADLLAVLRRHAADEASFDRFAEQWFAQVVLPRLELDGVRVETRPEGCVVAARLANTGTGQVEVVVAAMRGAQFDAAGADDPELRRADTTVVVGSGESVPIELRCDFVPDRIVIDPDVRVLQLGRSIHWL